MLKLDGVVSNKSAIGAVVKMKSLISGYPVWQVRKVAGQNGYCGQNLQVHFGLGDASQIDSIIIQWPSGIVQNVEGLIINEYNLVIEDTNAVSVKTEVNDRTTGYQLYQNYPNPFNPSTKISWYSLESGMQTLKIYDSLGREVATLLDEIRASGKYELTWSPEDIPSGIYFYVLTAGTFHQTRKMILLK